MSSDRPQTVISLTLDTGAGRLLRERQVAQQHVDGLGSDPPIVMFDREIVLAEDLLNWEPTE